MSDARSLPGAYKITLLASLYFAQGLPFGFFHRAVPVLVRKAGYSLAAVGATALLALPWSLKFLWAPFVDRYGSRRAWILVLQALAALLLAGLAFVPPGDAIGAMMGAFFLANLIAATQDIATDGLALDLLAPTERGFANGVQVGGYRLGMIVGGGGLLVLFESLGWRNAFLLMAGLLLISTLPTIIVGQRSHVHRFTSRDSGDIRDFFRRESAWVVVALLSIYKLGDALGTGMISSFLTDRGVSMSQQGWMLGTVGSIAGMAGALIGGALVTYLGRRISLTLFGVLLSFTLASYAWASWSEPSIHVLYVLAFLEHFASGMSTAALFTCMMDWCAPNRATDYTIQASVVVIATGLTTSWSGFVAQKIGFVAHFGTSAALMLLCTFAAHAIFPVAQKMARTSE